MLCQIDLPAGYCRIWFACLLLGAAARGADRTFAGDWFWRARARSTTSTRAPQERRSWRCATRTARWWQMRGWCSTCRRWGRAGPSRDGSRAFVASTDREGRAAAIGLKPNRVEGPFQIIVTVSAGGRTGRAEVRETNTLAGGDRAMKSGHGRLLGILLAVAGAAGGGIFAATRGGGGSSSSSATAAAVPTTLSAGTVTIGGPR